jgi:protein-S-isoprenylcysteine O-methyltransferase Ste14
MQNIIRHLTSFIAPIVVCGVLPYFIIQGESGSLASSPGLLITGFLIGLSGLTLLIVTIRMFILIGKGTIMPWDPTRRMIISGPYRFVRNPMILGVISIEVGEAILFASYGMVLLAALFFVINTVYFILSEEPGLEKRFGAEYVEYKKNVPRWIPRLKPWRTAGKTDFKDQADDSK